MWPHGPGARARSSLIGQVSPARAGISFFVVTYRRLLREGLQHARIDVLVGSAPLPPGMHGEEARPPASRGHWAAFRARPRTARLRLRHGRARDDGARRRAA
jgi:hypothetical protein